MFILYFHVTEFSALPFDRTLLSLLFCIFNFMPGCKTLATRGSSLRDHHDRTHPPTDRSEVLLEKDIRMEAEEFDPQTKSQSFEQTSTNGQETQLKCDQMREDVGLGRGPAPSMMGMETEACLDEVGQLRVPSQRQDHSYTYSVVKNGMAPDQAMIMRRSATPHLLGIDQDIRTRILDHLLLNRTRLLTKVLIVGDLQDILLDPHNLKYLQMKKRGGVGNIPLQRKIRDITAIAGTHVLYVCRQLYNEGITILYGRNRFVAHHFWDLTHTISHILGPSLARIKKLETTLPLDVKMEFDLCFGLRRYTGFFKREMPALCELMIRTAFLPQDQPLSVRYPSSRLNEEHRTMLYTAACIVFRHGNLAQAVWEAETQLQWRSGSPQHPAIHMAEDAYYLSVRILAADRALKLEKDRTKMTFHPLEQVVFEVRIT